MTRIVPVIMSGGSGTRLWPLSRLASPKQLHALVSDMTMVQETVRRVATTDEGFSFEPPLIVLNAAQHDLARHQLEVLGVEASHFVVEPFGRNTAPVAAVAAEVVRQQYGEDALVLLLPADHHIKDDVAFHRAVAAGAELAADGHIITFGIQPDRPETGYGYIRRGAAVGAGYAVDAFTEKPNRERAAHFLEDGRYYWNAGMFLFGVGTLAEAMQRDCPDVLEAAQTAVREGRRVDGKILLDEAAFAKSPSISFDYAVMERTDRAAVVPADIGWSDVGSWEALWTIAEKDQDGNVARGDVHLLDSRNSYVLSSGPHVGTIGIEDIVVVATGDAVLVTRRDRSQDVKRIVDALKAGERSNLL